MTDKDIIAIFSDPEQIKAAATKAERLTKRARRIANVAIRRMDARVREAGQKSS